MRVAGWGLKHCTRERGWGWPCSFPQTGLWARDGGGGVGISGEVGGRLLSLPWILGQAAGRPDTINTAAVAFWPGPSGRLRRAPLDAVLRGAEEARGGAGVGL